MRTLMMLGMVLAGGAAHAQVDPSFAPCSACHAVKPGQNKIGPSLHRAVGAKKASVPGYAYSPAMKAQTGVWSEKELDAYLLNPRAKVPGTKMYYAGMPDAAKRATLIAYLKTLK